MVRRCLVAVTVFLVASLGGSQDWPQFRGPDSQGGLDHGLPEGEGDLVLEQKWIRELGSGYSGIATHAGVLVTLFAAGEEDGIAGTVALRSRRVNAERRKRIAGDGVVDANNKHGHAERAEGDSNA